MKAASSLAQVPAPAEGTLTVEHQAQTSSAMILSPQQDQYFDSGQVLFAAALPGDGGKLKPPSVVIWLDDANVTSKAITSEYVVTFVADSLRVGAHTFRMVTVDSVGAASPASVIRFHIGTPKKEKRPSLITKGRAFIEGRRESVSLSAADFIMGGGELNAEYGKWDVESRLFLTSLEDHMSQPRHRFYLSVGHPRFKTQIGDVYPRYNDLILWGKRVRGLAGRIALGNFLLEATAGQTARAITAQQSETASIPGSFAQQLIAVRPGYELKQRLKAGLTCVKIKDDIDSNPSAALPMENFVMGPDFLITFDRGRFEVNAQAAWSMLTSNSRYGALTKADISHIFQPPATIPFDPATWQSLIIINDSTTPLSLHGWTSLAWKIECTLNYFQHRIAAGYRRIGSDYRSLANPWLRDDIRGFFIQDHFPLLKNRLFFTLGWQYDIESFSQVGAKPEIGISSIQATTLWSPGEKLPYLSVGVRTYGRNNNITAIETDSLIVAAVRDTVDRREKFMQREFSLQTGYRLAFLNVDHQFSVSYILNQKFDRYSDTRPIEWMPQNYSLDAASFSWTSHFSFPLRCTLSYSQNSQTLADGASNFNYHSIAALGEYALLNEKLSLFCRLYLISTNGRDLVRNDLRVQRQQLRIGFIYRLSSLMAIALEMSRMNYDTPENQTEPSYADHFIRFRYDVSY